jgi:hypothetical protein
MHFLPLAIGLTRLCPASLAAPLVPTLAAAPRDPSRIGLQAVEIHLPWPESGHLTLRLPETLNTNLGLLFIDHERPDMPPVARVGRLPDWKTDPATGALSYELALPNSVVFGGSATPGDGRVDFELWVRNGTAEALSNLHAQFCLMQASSPPFAESRLTRTYIHSEGRWLALADTTHEVMNPERGPWIITAVGDGGMPPHSKLDGCWYCCPERGDAAVIATTSPDGDRVIALAWDQGLSLMSNGWIPCLHNDPVWPAECLPDKTVRVKGRLYLLEGGLPALEAVLRQEVRLK